MFEGNLYLAVGILITLAVLQRVVYVSLFQTYFKITFKDAPIRSLLFFSLWALMYVVLFPAQISKLFGDVTLIQFLFLLFTFVVIFPAIFRFLRLHVGVPIWLSKTFPTQTSLSLEEQYIIAKTGDVVSQQLIAGILVLLLANGGVAYPTIVMLFVLLFAFSHVYLFFSSGFIWGLHYTMFATMGGFAIPFVILFVPSGIVYALICHMLFYVLSAAFFAKLPRPGVSVHRDILHDNPLWFDKKVPSRKV